MKFAYLYALPGYEKQEIHTVTTPQATFYSVAVDMADTMQAAVVAKQLVDEYDIDLLELCGALASAHTISQVRKAIDDVIPVGAVHYGPESRRRLVDLLNL